MSKANANTRRSTEGPRLGVTEGRKCTEAKRDSAVHPYDES